MSLFLSSFLPMRSSFTNFDCILSAFRGGTFVRDVIYVNSPIPECQGSTDVPYITRAQAHTHTHTSPFSELRPQPLRSTESTMYLKDKTSSGPIQFTSWYSYLYASHISATCCNIAKLYFCHNLNEICIET